MHRYNSIKSINVLIADDHNLVRAGFLALVKRIDGVEVVAEAQNGHDAWERILCLRPALALLDISMPLLNGLELTARIAVRQPATRVIVVSMHATDDYVQRAKRAGASGYLLKNTSPIELERAIRAVARGEMYFNLRAESQISGPGPSGERWFNRLDGLTSRQRELLQLIGEGHSTKEIARLLGISVKTAEAHRTNLMERLDFHEVTAVVRFAVAVGLVNPES